MKFTCEKNALLTGITIASRAVSQKSTVDVLEGLLLEAGEELVITGYNLKTGIRTTIEANIEKTGSIVLEAKLLGDIVRRMSNDTISISVSENFKVNLECAMSSYELTGFVAEDYPELPSVDQQNFLLIPENKLKSIISETIFAVSINETKPVHTGSLFEVEENVLTVVSVDGYRLALRRETLENATENISFVVPGAALSEAEKIASDSENLVKITLGTRHIMFSFGSTELISRRLEGEFLDYKKSIPIINKYEIIADRRLLIESVERVSLITNEKNKSPVRCSFGENYVKIQTMTSIGKAVDICEIKGDGEDLELGFNGRYFLDALKAAPSDSVRLMLNSGKTPCIVIPTDNSEKFLYLILPVRIRTDD